MSPSFHRSNRLNQLLKLRLNGATPEELFEKALSWSVTAGTAKSYVSSVEIQIQKIIAKRLNQS